MAHTRIFAIIRPIMAEIKVPRLSIVATARNDNYGGLLKERINTFIKFLVSGSNDNDIPTELIFVEYNPPENAPLFAEILKIDTGKFLTVRFIVVPRSFHQKINEHSKIPLLEYVAKNIGIKRARGEYIMMTNPDIIIGDEIFRFVMSNEISPQNYYRVDRHDITISNFDKNLSALEIIKKAKDHVFMTWVNDGVRYYSWKAWFKRFIHSRNMKSLKMCPIFNKSLDRKRNRSLIHDKAAGDFLLMHKDLWNKVGGFDQSPHNLFLDSYILYVLNCLGAKQKILPYPIYHIEHIMGRTGRPGIESKRFEQDVMTMLETNIPYKNPNPNWGFPEESFQEITENW